MPAPNLAVQSSPPSSPGTTTKTVTARRKRKRKKRTQQHTHHGVYRNIVIPWISKTLAAPVEALKLRNQVYPALQRSEDPAAVVRATATSSFAGNEATLLRTAISLVLNTYFKRHYKTYFKSIFSSSAFKNQFLRSFGVSAFSSFTAAIFLYPLDTWRTRASVGLKTSFTLKDLYGGSATGPMISAIGSILYRTVFFLLWSASERAGQEQKNKKAQSATFTFAKLFILSSIAGLIVFPFDTARRLLMVKPGISLRRLVREEGSLRFLWGGVWQNFVRSLFEGLFLHGLERLLKIAQGQPDRRRHRGDSG